MPQTRAKELRELPDEDLLERVESLKEELFNLRFQFATGQLDNPMRIRTVRHDIARLLTVLRQRGTEHELEEALARADEQALAESREAQARGDLARRRRPRGARRGRGRLRGRVPARRGRTRSSGGSRVSPHVDGGRGPKPNDSPPMRRENRS